MEVEDRIERKSKYIPGDKVITPNGNVCVVSFMFPPTQYSIGQEHRYKLGLGHHLYKESELKPYIEENKVTKEEAFDITCNMLLKLCYPCHCPESVGYYRDLMTAKQSKNYTFINYKLEELKEFIGDLQDALKSDK